MVGIKCCTRCRALSTGELERRGRLLDGVTCDIALSPVVRICHLTKLSFCSSSSMFASMDVDMTTVRGTLPYDKCIASLSMSDASDEDKFCKANAQYRCRQCPWRSFPRASRVAEYIEHLLSYTIKNQLYCSGTKQVKIVLSLRDGDALSLQARYLERSASSRRRPTAGAARRLSSTQACRSPHSRGTRCGTAHGPRANYL